MGVSPPQPTTGPGERRKLRQRVPGRSPRRRPATLNFFCILVRSNRPLGAKKPVSAKISLFDFLHVSASLDLHTLWCRICVDIWLSFRVICC